MLLGNGDGHDRGPVLASVVAHLDDLPRGNDPASAVHCLHLVPLFWNGEKLMRKGDGRLIFGIGQVHHEDRQPRTPGKANAAAGTEIFLERGKVGDRMAHVDGRMGAGRFTRITGKFLRALYYRDRSFLCPLLRRHTGEGTEFRPGQNTGGLETSGHNIPSLSK